MKKYVLLFLLLVGSQSYSQYTKAVTLGLDPKMAILGAYDYDKTPALHVFAKLILPENDIMEYGLKFNYTNSLNEWTNDRGEELPSSFFNWGIFANVKFLNWGENYHKYYSKNTLYYGVELTQVIRGGLYYSIGTNWGYRHMFNESIGVDVGGNFMVRPELNDDSNGRATRVTGIISAIYYFDN